MFMPKNIIIEENALEYKVGKNIYNFFKNKKIPIKINKTGRVGYLGDTPTEVYKNGKSTLVVGIRKKSKFQSCKPSAHYQLPLVSGCMGMCEYCYLNTQMGKYPYTKIYVNILDLLNQAKNYSLERENEITIFEGAATSDPLPVEPYTNSLRDTIEFIGKEEFMRFRFVTKYTEVDSLLDAKHNGHTEIRFTLNTKHVIKNFEHKTPSFEERINAARKTYDAGYKVGILIAPIFLYNNWQEEYKMLIKVIHATLPFDDITFEIITHRYTSTAKNIILDIFPQTILPMNDDVRQFKFGQFGYGKYIYTKDEISMIKEFFYSQLTKYYPKESILYMI